MRLAVLLSALTILIVSTLPAHAERREAKPTWQTRKLAELRGQRDALRVEVRGLRRQLAHRPSVREALRLASIAYDVPLSTLRRRAWCESRFNPRAANPHSSAKGLLQFLDGTWSSTPYRSESVYSAYANAFAAAWMMGPAGRGGEWECR